MASAWGKAWGKSFGAAWGAIDASVTHAPSGGGLVGYPVRIPTPHRRRSRRKRERTDLILIAQP